MRKLNAIKYWYGFMLMLATISFVACTDDNDDTESPVLEVSPTTLNFTAEGTVEEGSQAYFEITSNRSWTITIQDDKDWVTLSETEGSGNAKIEVSVPAGAVDEAKVDIQIGNKAGTLLSKTVTIRRGAGSEPVEKVVIYNETVGNDASAKDKPKVDVYTGWMKTGEGSANVTYSGGADVRNTGIKSAGYEGASGENNVFFAGTSSFVINKIALKAEQTNLKLTFGGSYGKKDDATNKYDNTFDVSKFIVSLSADGTSWTPITYTKNNGDAEHPYWIFATSDFTLKNAVSELYIKFEASVASGFRLDDITLATGIGGTEIDLNGGSTGPAETTPITIAELLEKGKALANQATEVIDAANHRVFEGVVQTIASGANNNNTLAVAVEGATEPGNGITLYSYDMFNAEKLNVTAGDKVKITLKANTAKIQNFNGWYEVTGEGEYATIEKLEGTATITPIEITSANIAKLADYQGMTVTVNGANSKEANGVWCTTDRNTGNTFLLGGTEFTVYCYKTSEFAGKTYVNNVAGGKVTGIVSVYNQGQILPRTLADVSDFISDAPMITSVSPAALTFNATGTKDVTVTVLNQNGAAITATLKQNSNNIETSVVGNTVSVTVTTLANEENILQISVANGTPVEVPITCSTAPAATYTLISEIANLQAGKYLMSAYVEKYSSTNFAPYSYHVWNGSISPKAGGDLETVQYQYDEVSQTLTAKDADEGIEIELVAVADKANTYYIKLGDEYLYSVSAENRKIALGDTPTEWEFSNNSNAEGKGIFPTTMLDSKSITLVSANATSKLIRSYGSTGSYKNGIFFFKKN